MAHRCSFEGSFAVDVELTWVLQSTGPRMIYHLLGILVDCFKCFISAKTVAARWMWPCGQGPGSRRGGSQLITDFFFDNGSGWLMHSHSSLTPRSVQDWWIAQKVAQQIKKRSRGSTFTASCRCPWYKEPHCNSEHTCSLVTQHTHTLACTRADAVHLLERSESKNKLWNSEQWRGGEPRLQLRLEALTTFLTGMFMMAEKSECCVLIFNKLELNLWHNVLLSKQGTSLRNDSEERNGSCWDANRCMFLINKAHIWISEKAYWKKNYLHFTTQYSAGGRGRGAKASFSSIISKLLHT